tara:strand:+ start:344 stop:538 length:195 start_codon:yes stop_codon:yes gene_type:complete
VVEVVKVHNDVALLVVVEMVMVEALPVLVDRTVATIMQLVAEEEHNLLAVLEEQEIKIMELLVL